ncbi:MAG: SPOR domain-containing protein [Rubrivivax sp.]
MIIGFVLGLVVAAGIAWLLTKSPNPFDGKSARSGIASPQLSSVEREAAAARQGERPRFDFSKILPGTDERKAAQKDEPAPKSPDKAAPPQVLQAATTIGKTPADQGAGKFFLQAGAYQNAADAEDQRAQLALMGIEAVLQAVTVPDKGTLNRVRLGPYGSAGEMNQVKAELQKQGVATAVIRDP